MKITIIATFILFCGIFFIAPNMVTADEGQSVNDLDTICSQSKNENSSLCIGWKQGSDNTDDSDNVVLDIITKVINFLAYAAGIMAVFYVIWGGFRYVKSAGSAEKAADGRKMIIYALVGVAVIVLSRYIILFFIKTIQ